MTPNRDARTLYALCTSADRQEVEAGFQQLGAYLLPVARNQLNDHYIDLTIVQDCVQESLRAIWQQLQRGDGPQAPEAFLAFAARITKNRAIDRYRYEKRRMSDPLDAEDDEQHTTTAALLSTPPESWPEQLVMCDEAQIILILSIRNHPKLNHRAKTILIEGYLFEKTDAELAQNLGINKGNVRLDRCRALKILRSDEQWMAALHNYLARE